MVDILLWLALALVLLATVAYWVRMLRLFGEVFLYAAAILILGAQAVGRGWRRLYGLRPWRRFSEEAIAARIQELEDADERQHGMDVQTFIWGKTQAERDWERARAIRSLRRDPG